MGSAEVNAFLTYLAVELHLSASTRHQVLSALLFLYRELLDRDWDLEGVIRAQTRPRLPVLMTVEEVELCWSGWMAWRRCNYGSMTLIFSVCRSRCAIARAVRIGARCCLPEWERNSKPICKRCVVCIARTLPRDMGGCASPTPWGENIPMHR